MKYSMELVLSDSSVFLWSAFEVAFISNPYAVYSKLTSICSLNHSSGYFPILLVKHCRTIYNNISVWLVNIRYDFMCHFNNLARIGGVWIFLVQGQCLHHLFLPFSYQPFHTSIHRAAYSVFKQNWECNYWSQHPWELWISHNISLFGYFSHP